MGFIPGLPARWSSSPDLVLVIFLPPLLYGGAFFADLHEPEVRSAVDLDAGDRARAGDDGRVAVVAHARRRGPAVGGGVRARGDRGADGPRGRHHDRAPPVRARAGSSTVIEGESLLNDGTALVAYRAAVTAVGGAFSLFDASCRVRPHGAPAASRRARRRVGDRGGPPPHRGRARRDDDLAAERLRGLHPGGAASAARACSPRSRSGVYLGWRAPSIASPAQRLTGFAVWEMLDLPAQRAALRAHRPAAPVHPRGPVRPVRRRR